MIASDQLIISFIIPVYNTGRFLRACLDSVLAVDVRREIIIINDGSTDDSAEIIAEYARRYPEIRIITQVNSGLSAARNVGITSARGEYLMMVDSDDIVVACEIEQIVAMAIELSPDIVVGRIVCFDENGTHTIWPLPPPELGVISGTEFMDKTILSGYAPMVFNYLFRRNFIIANSLTFLSGVIHEDELWTPQALVHANTVAITKSTHYLYRRHNASIMSTTGSDYRFFSLVRIIHKLIDELRGFTSGMESPAGRFLRWRIMKLMQIIVQLTPPCGRLLIEQLNSHLVQTISQSYETISSL